MNMTELYQLTFSEGPGGLGVASMAARISISWTVTSTNNSPGRWRLLRRPTASCGWLISWSHYPGFRSW